MGQIKDLAMLTIMSIMFVSTLSLFMLLVVGVSHGGITEQYDLNHYGEGITEVIVIGIGLLGSPMVIVNYIYGRKI